MDRREFTDKTLALSLTTSSFPSPMKCAVAITSRKIGTTARVCGSAEWCLISWGLWGQALREQMKNDAEGVVLTR